MRPSRQRLKRGRATITIASTFPCGPHQSASKKARNYEREASQCDDLCLRVLLTGTASRFLSLFPTDQTCRRPDAKPRLSFSLQRRDVCPRRPDSSQALMCSISLETETAGKADAIDLIQLRIATGECLIQRATLLSEAEIVITRGLTKTARARWTRVQSERRYDQGVQDQCLQPIRRRFLRGNVSADFGTLSGVCSPADARH